MDIRWTVREGEQVGELLPRDEFESLIRIQLKESIAGGDVTVLIGKHRESGLIAVQSIRVPLTGFESRS